MRPNASTSTLLSAVAPRRGAHGFGGSITGRKRRTVHLYDRMGPDGKLLPQYLQEFKEAPKLESAYPMPHDLPQMPLHIEQLSGRRLNWYERTMQEDKLSKDEQDLLKRAMERHKRPERPTVDFVQHQTGPSLDRMKYFEDPELAITGQVMEADEIPGIEPGRVVEIRRSNISSIGLVLAPILVAGRQRLLLLRSTGEIWPVSPNDVQFVMPASLVPANLAHECWSRELLQLWADGSDIGISGGEEQEAEILGKEKTEAMAAARRKVVTVLRRVARETERMEARLTGGTLKAGRGGGTEAVWDMLAPEDPTARTSVTAAQVAEHLLNAEGAGDDGTKRIAVRPATLPAFAAHSLLMRRPDLFLADDKDMVSSGTFLVRSRRERECIINVSNMVENDDPAMLAFVAKTKQVREALKNKSADIPQWTEQELDILEVLALQFFEARSTQRSITLPLVAAIARRFEPTEPPSGVFAVRSSQLSKGTVVQMLVDVGILPATDSMRTSIFNEAISRSFTLYGITPAPTDSPLAEPTAADAALDSLRADLSHRVFVIDDASAKELDDGVAVERIGEDEFWIHVHVADPTRFIERDGGIATNASVYGTSMYLPEGTVPLLPAKIGGGSSSLGEARGERGQATMVFSSRVDRAGNIHEHKIGLGFVQGAVVTTYAAVNEALQITPGQVNNPFGYVARDRLAPSTERTHATLTSEDKADLQLLRELSDAIRARRYATAGFEWWNNSHASTVHVLNGAPISNLFNRSHLSAPATASDPPQYSYTVTSAPPATTSQSIVAELMVLANRAAAHYCAEHGVPAPFRGVGRPKDTTSTPAHLTLEKMLASRELGTGRIPAADMLASNIIVPPVVLSTTPLPMWMMGIDDNYGYLRATSPLRRYDDMLSHWQIKATLGREAGLDTTTLDADEVLARTKRAYAGQSRANNLSKGAAAYWQAGIFADRLSGPVPEGYVFGVGDEPVDLAGKLTARVVGVSVVSADGVTRSAAEVASLGAVVDINHKAGESFELGEEVDVKMQGVQLWPNPVVVVQTA